MSEHNHPNIWGFWICSWIMIGAGSVLLLPIIIPLLRGYEIFEANPFVFVSLFFGILLWIAWGIMAKETSEIEKKCEACK